MKKNLLLYILLTFLVVMNGFFLFKHFGSSDKKDPQRGEPVNFITAQLKFDEAQTIQFEKLDAEHRRKMRAIQEDIKVSKDGLFDKLSDKTVDKRTIDSIVATIASSEAAKDVETFYFFKSIREICNENQKEQFESIIKDAIGRPGPPGRNGPPGGPRGERRPPPPRD